MTNVLELDERLETALEAYRKDHEDSEPETVLREALEGFLIEHGYLTRKRKVPKSVGSVRSDFPDLPYRDEELLWSER
jgi:hypothetical protein